MNEIIIRRFWDGFHPDGRRREYITTLDGVEFSDIDSEFHRLVYNYTSFFMRYIIRDG